MATWDSLTIEQQTLLLTIPSSGVHISFDSVLLRSLGQLGLVECIRSNEIPQSLGVGVSITPAGRALLPAPTLTPSELDAAIYGTPEYWRQMSNASIEAHTETLQRVKALEDENARLRAGIQAVLDNGLEHWASGDWYVQDEKSGKMWKGVREAAAGLKELLGK